MKNLYLFLSIAFLISVSSISQAGCGPRFGFGSRFSSCGPSSCGPSSCGPSSCGPSSCGPSSCGPSSCGPSSCGPSSCGPSSCGPSSGCMVSEFEMFDRLIDENQTNNVQINNVQKTLSVPAVKEDIEMPSFKQLSFK